MTVGPVRIRTAPCTGPTPSRKELIYVLRLTKRVPRDAVENFAKVGGAGNDPVREAIYDCQWALSAAASETDDGWEFASEVNWSLRNDQSIGDTIVVAYLNRPARGTATAPGELTPAPNDDRYEDVVTDG